MNELYDLIPNKEKPQCLRCGELRGFNTKYSCTSNKSWTAYGYEYDCEGPSPPLNKSEVDDCQSCPAAWCQKCVEGNNYEMVN